MSLDPTTLKLVMESGSGRQKIYAKLIYRVRRYGNYLLCTLLLGNVLVNNTLTILLDSVLGSGLYAVIASTVAIVIFGEIVPQAICSRHALTIGAYTIWLTYIFMALTFPLSFPISLILHFILGKEIGAVYTRNELLGLLKVTEDHHGIGKDEVQIISGALKFKEKTAEDVMTNFEYVYCLDIQSVLDFRTIREIYDSGFSRIPVYEETKSNIVGVLYAKDLAFVDPDDEMPLKQVLNFYNRELTSVYNDTKLDELLEQFAGGQCHLAVVNIVVQEGSGDPQLQVVGVVTLEDIVEEILQLEIVDETDRIMDNRSQKPRQRNQVDVGGFMGDSPRDRPHMSSQQRLAVYQFLSSSVEAFKSGKILPGILRRLLLQDVVRQYTQEEIQARNVTLYRINIPTSSFTLVLEGHVEVEVGKEGMKFEAGPFHHFGVQALELADSGSGDYVPDFTVRPVSDCVLLMISCNQYLDARKATKFQKTKDQESPAASLFSNHTSPLSSRVEGSVSAPGKLVNGRASRSGTSVKSVPKRLRMGGRQSDREESHRLLLEEDEEDEQVLPSALMSPSSSDGGSSARVTVVEVEMYGVDGGRAEDSSTEPLPDETPHSAADYTPL
ncbi:Metal transporter CNNM2 [Geodia barretti]|uniref:Metal transporter CNNM2 n=2 Tax=Geodia barretti TaxID=519541 RepID=A0AA35QVS4_GEOBA|nr:Metal transporter CNNM2 [Geodia barretti]